MSRPPYLLLEKSLAKGEKEKARATCQRLLAEIQASPISLQSKGKMALVFGLFIRFRVYFL